MNCDSNQLSSLNVSGCTALKRLCVISSKYMSVIPKWFSQLEVFSHCSRFEYWKETVYVDGEYVEITRYKDNGYGWWYPGEPEKGYHGPN